MGMASLMTLSKAPGILFERCKKASLSAVVAQRMRARVFNPCDHIISYENRSK
jgi:hypothetical protein